MKNSAPAFVFFAATTTAADIVSLLPLLKKLKCAVPCVTGPADALSCIGGSITTLCKNKVTIGQLSQDCVGKCGIDKKQLDFIFKLLEGFC
ncbi:hypothetical protein LEL_10872 [Akanthomyces lecanii RCEF 1005]|uniref:Uncharacterized protein n=1 Tax=Akanthomyces lecanii RCEF 1005 TaxID=1081108 RepID=A0A167RSX4_CORDF|nr:hypothetical protein LEL_10872 [Akanthomyces lecanii RCEF 1005]